MIMLAQTPVLGIFLLLLFRHHVFGVAKGGPLVATQLVFLLVMITIWLGALDASREIVKEKAIFGRERAMGVTIPAYLLSKVVVLFALVLVQATILLGLTAILRPFHEGFGTYLQVFGILAVTGFAAIGMGLLVSSVAGNEDQATALAPVAMTMQLLVGGGIVTVKSMTFVMKAVSTTSFGRWAFQGIGTQLHMNARFAANGISPAQNQYGASFFRLGIGETYALLIGFTLLFFAAISGILARRKAG
jgi:ABC-type multidrug transport system permease subunit